MIIVEGKHSFIMITQHDPRIHAYWVDQETVTLSITPLEVELQIHLPFKEVSRRKMLK